MEKFSHSVDNFIHNQSTVQFDMKTHVTSSKKKLLKITKNQLKLAILLYYIYLLSCLVSVDHISDCTVLVLL